MTEKEKILIVDDDESTRKILSLIFKREGYEGETAGTVREALEKAQDKSIRVAILDIMLPDRKGMELIRPLKEMYPDISVIMITGHASVETAVQALNAGASSYVTKPVNMDEILSKVKDVLEKQDLAIGKRQAEERIGHLNAVLRAIRNVNQLITQERDQDRLLQGVCDGLVETRGFFNAWIALQDGQGQMVTMAHAGLDREFVPLGELLKQGMLPDTARKALVQSRAVTVKNPLSECKDCPLKETYGDRGAISVRLEHGGKVYGLLVVSVPGSLVGDEEESGLLEEVASDIAYALNNMAAERERARAVEALKASERKYQDLYDNAPDMYVSVEAATGSILECNETAADALGYEKAEIIGRPIFDLYTPQSVETSRQKVFPAFIKTGAVRGVELQLQRKDGSVIDVSLNVSAVRDEKGNILYSRSSWRDISETKALESQLRQSQKMQAIGTLAGGIAHDFNNILSAIVGYTDLAKMKLTKKSEVLGDLDEISKASRRAKDLVRHILTLSRQHEQEKTPLQLKYIVKEVLRLLRATLPSTIEFREDLAGDTGLIDADPSQMHQVLMNLCTNAGHAMREEGGILAVSLQNADLKTEEEKSQISPLKTGSSTSYEAVPSDLEPGRYVRLTVSDTGCGMNRDVKDRIFEPYFTTREMGEGTGLGLSVVHGIIKAHGGSITVESETGKGSSFHIYLPIQESEKEVVERETRPRDVPTGNERILLVDDERAILEVGQQILGRLGYDVVTKASSMEALELFREDPDRFDLVITDMTMPGVRGDRLAKELINIRPGIRIILCTGHSDFINEEIAREIGIQAYVMKPLVSDDLARKVRDVLDAVTSNKEREP